MGHVEQLGEVQESLHKFYGRHSEGYFDEIVNEAADFISCLVGVANSADIDIEKELEKMYSNNCHECNKAPCTCSFDHVAGFIVKQLNNRHIKSCLLYVEQL